MTWFDTRAVILTAGVGSGSAGIVAFDAALRSACIADFNLIRVTSIVPPNVPVYRMKAGAEAISGAGHMLPTVYAHETSDRAGLTLSSSVGVGVPQDRSRAGVIFPNSGIELDEQDCIAELEKMIGEAMAQLRRADQCSFRYASASGAVPKMGGWYCSLSALCFADNSLWPLFEDRVELVAI